MAFIYTKAYFTVLKMNKLESQRTLKHMSKENERERDPKLRYS